MSGAQRAANAAAMRQVTVTSCSPDAHQAVAVSGTAHNASARPVSFMIQLAIRDPAGKRFYATAASVSNVAPNGTARWEAATTAAYTSGMTCTVTTVALRPS